MTKPKSQKTASAKNSRLKAPARGPVRSRYSPAEVREIFRRFAIQRPEPRGELEHVNPFTLLVAVVLSAQATDAGVNKATRALFKVADTPRNMAELGEERLGVYPHHRPVAQQGQERHRALSRPSSATMAARFPPTATNW